MKICTKCKVATPDDMMINGGLGSWCKQCSKDYTRRFKGTERGRAYSTYNCMLQRCYNPKAVRYEKYGGSGVTVCNEWLGEEGFNSFFEWYKLQTNNDDSDYQIDKDTYCNANGIKPHIYSPGTCRYIKRSENQRNYSTLLVNNTSGYTGVTKSKDGTTWDFRLHREHTGNINRGRFATALEAAKAREACIIANDLNFKLEHVGSTMELSEKPVLPFTFYSSSNYSMIRRLPNGKYTGTVNLINNKRKSIGVYLAEKEASDVYNTMIVDLDIEHINKPSILFGFKTITKDVD